MASAGGLDDKLPIDIEYTQLIEWLQARRHLPSNWHRRLKRLRYDARALYDKSNLAELPASLDAHEYVPYLSVHAAAEVDRTWASLAQRYRRRNVHLADLAQHLKRLVSTDFPLARQRAARLTAEARDLSQRADTAGRAAADARARVDTECSRFGIRSVDCGEAELERHVEAYVARALPEALRVVAEATRELRGAVEHYQAFARFVRQGAAGTEAGGEENGGVTGRCPVLRQIMEADVEEVVKRSRTSKGNAETEEVAQNVEQAPMNSDEIDWGFDIETFQPDDQGGQLDMETPPAEPSATGAIDWGIEVSDDATPAPAIETEDDTTFTDGPSLQDVDTREGFLTDLAELDAFVDARLGEVRLTRGAALQAAAHVRSLLPVETEENLLQMRDAVQCVRDALPTELLALNVGRAARRVRQRAQAATRAADAVHVMDRRAAAVREQLATASAESAAVARDTARAADLAQNFVQGLVPGWRVELLGDVGRVVALAD